MDRAPPEWSRNRDRRQCGFVYVALTAACSILPYVPITPPIGMNLFVIAGVAKDLKTRDVIRGVIPFIVCDIVRVALLVSFPILVTWLPSTMR